MFVVEHHLAYITLPLLHLQHMVSEVGWLEQRRQFGQEGSECNLGELGTA